MLLRVGSSPQVGSRFALLPSGGLQAGDGAEAGRDRHGRPRVPPQDPSGSPRPRLSGLRRGGGGREPCAQSSHRLPRHPHRDRSSCCIRLSPQLRIHSPRPATLPARPAATAATSPSRSRAAALRGASSARGLPRLYCQRRKRPFHPLGPMVAAETRAVGSMAMSQRHATVVPM